MNPMIILGGVGLSLFLLTRKSGQASNALPVTGSSGGKWLLELVGRNGSVGSYIVFQQANPPIHDKYPVLQFSQVGDSADRTLVAKFPSVPKDVYDRALKDFSVKATF